MKIIRAILIGVGIWTLAVSFYTLSYQFPIQENADQQANMVLFTAVMPLVWFGAHLYYKYGSTTHGFKIGEVFFLIAAFLDAIITVPVFVIPNGGNHFTFFTDPGFWIIGLEMLAIASLYYYSMIYPKTKSPKA